MSRTIFGLIAAGIFAATQPVCAATNLVPNGDFEAGNVDFTSGYSYVSGSNGAEGQYTVRDNPYPWNPLFASAGDHTSGAGLMFVGNGSARDGQIVWQSAIIDILAGTDYFFEAFVLNACCATPFQGNTAPILRFSITLDGATSVLDTLTIPLEPAGIWHGLSTSFNSGTATKAVLSLVNGNTAASGNDFAVDDIFLGTTSIVNPSVPEPSTWAMMLLGFGTLGAFLRRRTGSRAMAG